MREAFEKWAKTNLDHSAKVPEDIKGIILYGLWSGWQAAWNSRPAVGVDLSRVKIRQFWIEDDDYGKPHQFVEVSDLQALQSTHNKGVDEFIPVAIVSDYYERGMEKFINANTSVEIEPQTHLYIRRMGKGAM